jgi:spoIIIJ-associated protein
VIGRKGQVVDALQHLVSKVVYRERSGEKGKPIIVDAGGYRDKQIERLRGAGAADGREGAGDQADRPWRRCRPHDRRIVHMAIAEMPASASRSEGEGDDRHILVVPDVVAK